MTTAGTGFIERAATLKTQVELIKQLDATANLERGLETRKGQLQPKAIVLELLASQFEQCVSIGTSIDTSQTSVSNVRSETKRWHEEFKGDFQKFATDQA